MTVSQLLANTTSRELTMWSVYLDAAEERRSEAAEIARQNRDITGS